MRSLKASLAPSGDVILSMSREMLMELQALVHSARENYEAVSGKFGGSDDLTRYLLTKHLKWEVRLDDAVKSILHSLPNVESSYA
jgi:hypothetical protein